jgi:hypothetical protein
MATIVDKDPSISLHSPVIIIHKKGRKKEIQPVKHFVNLKENSPF